MENEKPTEDNDDQNKRKDAFDQLGTNLLGQAGQVKSLGIEVKKAFADLDSNLKAERRAAAA